ncbi:MAG TPA: Ig-like domain-containing protein [Acidimicrobiales bacterium]|nr:Ig-like domain-containing protein [Acidimicrobiales bacterium]
MRQLRRVLLSAKVGIGLPVVVAGTLVAAVLVPGTSNACFPISGGKGFGITSVLTAYPSCSGPTAYLYPGVRRCLVYTAHNPLHVPITVNSLGITSVTLTTQPRDPSLPACNTAELDLSRASFSGSLVVPALGAASVAEPISLIDNGANQDNCENATFNFVYTGTGTYTDTTSTVLTSAPNPSKSGQMVTFIATVTPTDSPPSNPTGTVGFYLCPTVNCVSARLLGSVSVGRDGRATYSTSTLPVGTDLVEAVYKSPATDFAGSTSALVAQVVKPATCATTTTLVAWPDPAALGGPVMLTAAIAGPYGTGVPSGTVSFYSGNPMGPNTLLGVSGLHANAEATFITTGLRKGTDSLYAVYGGDNNFEPTTSAVVAEIIVVPLPPRTGHSQNSSMSAPASPAIGGVDQSKLASL